MNPSMEKSAEALFQNHQQAIYQRTDRLFAALMVLQWLGGIAAALILGLGRALGETMAVTMVIGNRPQIVKSLFAPGYTMASVLANEFSEATGNVYLSALIEIGLALFLVTIVVNALARLLVWTVTRGQPARGHA